MIDLSGISSARIEAGDLEKFSGAVRRADFVILKTGWGKYWGTEEYFGDYPVLTPDAAKWLSCFKLKGIGVDAISVDCIDSPDLPVHRILLKNNMVIIENLANLDSVPGNSFTLCALPLRTMGADGSPVRAIAFIDS